MPYVQAFFAPYQSKGLSTAARIYQATFLPATLDRGTDMGVETCNNSGDLTFAHTANKVFDIDNKGFIRSATSRTPSSGTDTVPAGAKSWPGLTAGRRTR